MTDKWTPILLGLLCFLLLLVAFANVMRLVDPPAHRATITCPSGYPWYNIETGFCYQEPVR